MTYRLGKCVEDSLYRYSLAVETDAAGAKSLVIVQCNPSLASSTRSDPTVGKVSTWAEETGFASVVFLNLFARRSPNVAEISQLPYADLVGPRNDEVLTRYSSTQQLSSHGARPCLFQMTCTNVGCLNYMTFLRRILFSALARYLQATIRVMAACGITATVRFGH
ncbi:MAG: DUF1643 domain-containing protein [Lysobacteraceae bacterium]